MGGGGGSSPPPYQPPPVPDPAATAAAQTGSNVDTAIANATIGATNQVTPYGNLTYTQTGGRQVGNNFVPSYTATQTLSPDQQRLYDQFNALQNRALGTADKTLYGVDKALSTPLDYSGAPVLPTDQTQLRDEAYKALTARSTQDIGNAETAQAVSLRNQGVQEGSEAWNRAMQPYERSRVDASTQATIGTGTVAEQNLQMAQQLRNQWINEYTQQRNQPINDYSAIMGFSGGLTNPTWAGNVPAQVSPTDVAGIINANTSANIANAQTGYQGQLKGYDAQQASARATQSGLFGLGSSAIGAGAAIGGAAIMV